MTKEKETIRQVRELLARLGYKKHERYNYKFLDVGKNWIFSANVQYNIGKRQFYIDFKLHYVPLDRLGSFLRFGHKKPTQTLEDHKIPIGGSLTYYSACTLGVDVTVFVEDPNDQVAIETIMDDAVTFSSGKLDIQQILIDNEENGVYCDTALIQLYLGNYGKVREEIERIEYPGPLDHRILEYMKKEEL